MPKKKPHAVRLEQLEITYPAASTLSPNTYNPNRQSAHDFELLLRSMRDDGFTQPIIGHEESRQIVDGEHRWTASIVLEYLTREHPIERDAFWSAAAIEDARTRRLELLEAGFDPAIPVVLVDMTPEQMRVSTLRHNRARGSEDVDLSAAVLRDLQALGAIDWAQQALALDDAEVDRLLSEMDAPEALAAEAFGTAWEPGRVSDEVAADPSTGSVDAGRGAVSMSRRAVEEQRVQERKLAEAHTAEERAQVRRESDVYRLTLMFTGEEADLVRGVLGKEPAQTVLTLCRERVSEGE